MRQGDNAAQGSLRQNTRGNRGFFAMPAEYRLIRKKHQLLADGNFDTASYKAWPVGPAAFYDPTKYGMHLTRRLIVNNEINMRHLKPRRGNSMAFLQGFLRHPELVASIIPSSRFLERRIIDTALISQARLVVELGPGTGGTTRAILNALPTDGKLLAIEITPEFIALLNSHPDPRLTIHHGSAEHIREALSLHGLSRPDVVVSGIPFSTMPQEVANRILAAVWSSLAPGGQFVAYQFRDRVALLGRKLFGRPKIEMELLNVPPMRIYQWRKPSVESRLGPPRN
jgi:phosphatidylethanolamine/phosphatidyl-N-methylethanolamine N-methyltransferase